MVSLLNLGAIVLSMVFFVLYRWLQYREYIRHDVEEQTQDDFALYVKNIPTVLFEKKSMGYARKLRVVFNEILQMWMNAGKSGAHDTKLWTSYI